MSKNKITKWEAGNEIVKAADALSECILEVKDFPEIRKDLIKLRNEISRIFKKNDFEREMGFGI